jgi:hypothetical protein
VLLALKREEISWKMSGVGEKVGDIERRKGGDEREEYEIERGQRVSV